MTSERNINAPIRILLLGSDTMVGVALLAFAEGLNEFHWHTLNCAELLHDHADGLLLADYDCDVIIDALSIDRPLDPHYPMFRQAVADVAQTKNRQVLMISSALVFSGNKETAYEETDEPDGQEDYASALVATETLLLQQPQNIVLRTGWLFSGTHDDFVYRTIALIKQGVNLAYDDNCVGSPSPASDLARVSLSMIKQHYYGANNTGIYHYCCAEEVSWFGFVESILATTGQFDAATPVSVEAINEFFPDSTEVTHIKRQSLSCKKIFNHFGVKQRPWRASLRKLVKKLYQPS